MEKNKLVEVYAELMSGEEGGYNIDRETLMKIMEDVFRHILTRRYGNNSRINIILNVDHGDLEIQRTREIVEDGNLTDPDSQIELSDAIKIESDFEVGEDLTEFIRVEDLDRRDILAFRQNFVAKITEYKKDQIYKKYKERIGEIVNGEVYQIWKKEILLHDDEGVELILPKGEQIPRDFYKKGETKRAVVKGIEMKNGSPQIIVSRISPIFLERLFEEEVPEVSDGLITIKNIVREPGVRAKISVESYDDRIDPAGACIGVRGSRIHGIVQELRNENIDVVPYTANATLYIERALKPAKISSVELDDEERIARVYMKSDQVSKAIGTGGCNIKLASRLTGYEIEVYSEKYTESESDVDLQEFADTKYADYIEQWIIDSLKNKAGWDTAKAVLEHSVEEIAERADLEIETAEQVVKVLQAELSKGDE